MDLQRHNNCVVNTHLTTVIIYLCIGLHCRLIEVTVEDDVANNWEDFENTEIKKWIIYTM